MSLKVHSYSFKEIFAEKISALAQRARSRDLYDVILLYRNREFLDDKSLLKSFREKCWYKNIAIPTNLRIYGKPIQSVMN